MITGAKGSVIRTTEEDILLRLVWFSSLYRRRGRLVSVSATSTVPKRDGYAEESFVDDMDSTRFGSRSMSETDLKDASGIYDIPRVLMRPPEVLTVQEKLEGGLIDEASSMPGFIFLEPPRVSRYFYNIIQQFKISPFLQAEIYLNLLEDGDDSLPSRFLSMPNEIESRVETSSNVEASADGMSERPNLTSSSESEVDIARILDPFEQLERECNGESTIEVREYCVMAGDGGSEELKVIKSDSDEGVVADDEGGDVVLARYVNLIMRVPCMNILLYRTTFTTGVWSLVCPLKVGTP